MGETAGFACVPPSAGGVPLSKSSTHGWMMTANTCAPAKARDRRHLETEVKGIMNIESAEYSASEAPWQTTSSTAFRGFDNKTMRNAKLPTTMDPNQPNQTFPDEEEEFQRQTRYQSSHKTQFLDFSVGKGRHVDPGRLEKQSAMGPAITTSANAYANPGRESYQPLRKIDPFRHTSTAWNESWKMSDQHTESRSNFHPHPAGYERVKSMKHLHSELVFG